MIVGPLHRRYGLRISRGKVRPIPGVCRPSLAGRTLILPFPILKAKIADLGHNRSRSSIS